MQLSFRISGRSVSGWFVERPLCAKQKRKKCTTICSSLSCLSKTVYEICQTKSNTKREYQYRNCCIALASVVSFWGSFSSSHDTHKECIYLWGIMCMCFIRSHARLTGNTIIGIMMSKLMMTVMKLNLLEHKYLLTMRPTAFLYDAFEYDSW